MKMKTNILPWKSLKEVAIWNTRNELNEYLINELMLYIENDGALYRKYTKPLMKSLAKKMALKQYNSSVAEKMWQELVNLGAKKYIKEFGPPETGVSYNVFDATEVKWDEVFPATVRMAVAKELTENFEDKIKNKELDLDTLIEM